MFILIDIRKLSCGLDTPTEDINMSHIPGPVETLLNAEVVAVTNGDEIKILKDRHGIHQVNKVFHIKELIFFIYRYQTDQEIGTLDPKQWILKLTKFLNSKDLRQMSIEMEKLAFEKT